MIKERKVLEALQDNMAYEYEDDGSHRYYLHIKNDGTIVDDYASADESFYAEVSYPVKENEKNPEFIGVVEELTRQANEYLEDIAE